jgi:hypothetical protein
MTAPPEELWLNAHPPPLYGNRLNLAIAFPYTMCRICGKKKVPPSIVELAQRLLGWEIHPYQLVKHNASMRLKLASWGVNRTTKREENRHGGIRGRATQFSMCAANLSLFIEICQ